MHGDSSYSKENSLLMGKEKLRRKLTARHSYKPSHSYLHKLYTPASWAGGKITIIFPFIII